MSMRYMPWFHFDPNKATDADIGVTKCLSNFVLKYADKGSDIYNKAVDLKEKYKECEQVLLEGYPNYDPQALNIKDFDTATWPAWLPASVFYWFAKKQLLCRVYAYC